MIEKRGQIYFLVFMGASSSLGKQELSAKQAQQGALADGWLGR